MPRPAALRIGLTGGIGSGKSTVAGMLQDAGAGLIDTDAIARSLTGTQGAAIDALRRHFGPEAIAADGTLDRAWMRTQAFADPGLRRQLEAILHPMIGARVEQMAADLAGHRCIVFDVPLLVESGHWRSRVDRVLVVDCPEEVQIERVVRRSQWSRETVLSVMQQQASRAERRAAADAVIDNRSDGLAALHDAVRRLQRHWRAER